MNFKKLDEPTFSDDTLYDLIYGGHIDPYELFDDPEEAKVVADAISLIRQFLDEAEEEGVLEIG
jgi:hypothetical protein